MNFADLATEAAGYLSELQSVRRDIHRHPELGLQTPKTLDRVIASISELPIEITRTDSMTGAIVRISGGKPGPTVLLRADLDALALQEDTGLDFASEIPGRMHACGHDLHAAIAVGAIHLITTHRDELAGEVLFMLQPGEEGYRGADHMLDEGLLAHARGELVGAYGLHVMTSAPLGHFVTRPGALMASAATLDVTVRGRGGHGSAPQTALDPNQALAEIVTGLQTMVTRRFSAFDPVIITVGWLSGGERGTSNVIPSEASFGATVRTFSEANLAAVEKFSSQLVAGIAEAHGLSADIEFSVVTVPLLNDAGHVDLAERVAGSMFGPERFSIAETPVAGGEDFASVLLAVPGAFVFVGACPPELDPETAPYNHSNLARFDDSVLPDAAAYLAALAFARLDDVSPSA
ncbi:hippurate hydrolase [Cryobacterium mesophilum]|uniref:Amidohydrolase n=1 Tax=Terrimesophilobacter mesophilus TaxID=433647 RepID=A0A4R8VFK3_9MICO|nr:M20 family metallopeptidase [Terrimesophilobacter mesophilus]MBB5633953.1 hippurate hydrolase [Terrimesophilobacter mesophilus]TFB80617.1 amidohydrolase [Terrimesophilobacter mesophilus]